MGSKAFDRKIREFCNRSTPQRFVFLVKPLGQTVWSSAMAVTMGEPRHRPDGVCVGSPPAAKKSKGVLANKSRLPQWNGVETLLLYMRPPPMSPTGTAQCGTTWMTPHPPSTHHPPDQHMHRLLHNLPSEKNMSSCVKTCERPTRWQQVCLHGFGCWARARALARTFSSTSSSTSFDGKNAADIESAGPPPARVAPTPAPHPHALCTCMLSSPKL